MKRELITIILLIIMSSAVMMKVLAQEIPQDAQKIADIGQRAQETTQKISENSPDYLTTELKKALLSNPKIKAANDWMETHQLLFLIMFGQTINIAQPLEFLIVIALWIYFAIQIYKIIKSAFGMKWYYNIASAILGSIILAQARLYKGIAYLAEYLIFKPEAWWVRIIVLAIILIIFVIVSYTNKQIAKGLGEKRGLKGREETERNMQIIQKEAEGLQRGMNALGG